MTDGTFCRTISDASTPEEVQRRRQAGPKILPREEVSVLIISISTKKIVGRSPFFRNKNLSRSSVFFTSQICLGKSLHTIEGFWRVFSPGNRPRVLVRACGDTMITDVDWPKASLKPKCNSGSGNAKGGQEESPETISSDPPANQSSDQEQRSLRESIRNPVSVPHPMIDRRSARVAGRFALRPLGEPLGCDSADAHKASNADS